VIIAQMVPSCESAHCRLPWNGTPAESTGLEKRKELGPHRPCAARAACASVLQTHLYYCGRRFLAPTTYKELEQQLRRRLERLTPHQQRLAQRVLSDPEGCAFQTVTQLAESVAVNESTVVRLATALGLDGYPALARLCQQRLREQAQMLERFEALQYLESVDSGSLARAASFDQANIARTFANIDEQAWDEAVRALAAARIVQVVGLRKSFAPATLFRYLLGLVRDEVYQLGAVHGTLPDALRRLRPGDVLVGIAIHRYVRETVQALVHSHTCNAPTSRLIGSPRPPARGGSEGWYDRAPGPS
jgi:DNA-binding MurR/RpiR family transcriptional regulator